MPKKKVALSVVETPQAGHNAGGITSEVYNKWWNRIEQADAKCKLANAHRNTERKQARAAGIRLTEFDAMRLLVELPRAEAIDKLTAARSYLIFMRSPLGEQMSMDFDAVDPFNETDETAKLRIVADAGAAGYRAGLAGVVWEDSNPHEVPSDEGQAWIGGWREGQTEKTKALGDDADSGS